ncbi:urea amidolyase family protein [Intrasporangium sp. YIM S08009]|uniref:5-oxoprolinase subunit B/C family protein n=1 Tax=Intrasporangium zincisolvens TaxID=3080018 RepID=UPI002B054762|nr:urea amidolyase family protein [Intrasporangium sp. YIM S08009]
MPPEDGRDARLLPMGEDAVLVEVGGTVEAVALRDRVRALVGAGGSPWSSVREVVAAARTVLVRTDASSLDALGRACLEAAATLTTDPPPDASGGSEGGGGRVVEVPVVYDGPDLDEVAALTGLTRDAVARAHTGTAWRVGFGGFAPGFAYLVGGDPRLRVPRRAEPRTRVPAGSVGLAGEFSGVYPQDSPGGWQLVGTTDAVLWDPDRDPPALLGPGTTVRFVDVSTRPTPDADRAVTATAPVTTNVTESDAVSRGLEVLATGPLVLVEDLGRPGLGDVGVGRSGAADRAAYLLGVRLVGHAVDTGDPAAPSPASLEVTLGGLAVRARGDLLVALTGASGPATVDGRPVGHAAPLRLRDGQVLEVATPSVGLRTYLALRGGIDVAPVLRSRSVDTLSGLGPPAVRPGDVLPVGPAPEGFPVAEQAPQRWWPTGDDVVVLDVTPGPRAEWCDLADLPAASFTVSSRSNRVGLRLEGSPVRRVDAFADAELPSEPLVAGAVQVPPGGEPVVFLADHPVTGGYPVVAVVTRRDVDRAAQLRPGDRVRLRWA